MSKEIALLRRVKVLLECSNMEPLQRQTDLIIKEIQELLAQPECNWVEYQRGHSTAVLELKRNLKNIFIGMGL